MGDFPVCFLYVEGKPKESGWQDDFPIGNQICLVSMIDIVAFKGVPRVVRLVKGWWMDDGICKFEEWRQYDTILNISISILSLNIEDI